MFLLFYIIFPYLLLDFLHEQYLLIEEGEKRYLISGCSHKGIADIVSWFTPDILIGGFHFSKMPLDVPEVKQAGIQKGHPVIHKPGQTARSIPYLHSPFI